MRNRIKSVLSIMVQRPLHEKILFFVALFSVVGVVLYYICCVPYIGNSEVFHPLLLAKEIIRTGQLLPTDWTFRNDIWFFSSHLLYIIPAFFTEDSSVCIAVVGIIMVIGGCAVSIYCARSISLNNCWLIFITILWCGISSSYLAYMFRQPGYLFQIIFLFLTYVLASKSFDKNLNIESRKKLIASCLLIALMGISGIKALQEFLVPMAGGLVIYFVLDHIDDNGIVQTIKNKSFFSMLIGVASVFCASAVGFIIYKVIISNNIVGFFQSTESNVLFVDDIGTNFHNLLTYFVNICGIEDQTNILSFNGIVGVLKIAINILMLIVFPIIQLTKYKNESTGMKLFMLFALVHVAEILILSIFSSSLTAERYLYSSILLLYYISAHYIFKNILCLEKNFGIKALITVFAIAVFAVPSTCTMLKKAGNYEKNIKNSIVVTDFLQSKGLVYGYGTYWNSDRFTAFSDFKVKVNKVRVDKTVYAHYFMCSSYDYSEEAYQGPTFLILTEDEKDIFLDSESYLKLGEPTEVCDISKFTIFIYDYNIANNNFEGVTGGFTGIETEKINAACRQYNVDIVLRYDSGYITQIIGGDTNNITEIDGDYNILVLTHDRLAEPAKMLDTPIGEYNLYMCKMSELGYTPNPNYVSGSDFEDDGDLSEWSVGGGETAVCNDGSLTITCTRESDRRFEQTITISEEQIGKPMTISFEISSIDGYVLTRIWGADFNANRYITETISEPGKYSFTFTPTSDEITIQPILPEKLNNGAVVEWVKLESGSVATDYVA